MVENIQDFLRGFTEEELAGRGVLRGLTRVMQLPSIDPLIGLMKERGVQKLECQDCDWFLDVDRMFHNPHTGDPGGVFWWQNIHLNPYYRGYRATSFAEADDELESRVTDATTITFGLERDLQEALRDNIEQLERGLKVVDAGSERHVASGSIDITAQDRQGNLVVIELKAGKAGPDSLTQLLAYMGALGHEEQKPIRGMLVARDFHERVVWGAQAVPGVQLKEYSFRFLFSDR